MAHDITCQHIVQLHSEWSKLGDTNLSPVTSLSLIGKIKHTVKRVCKEEL